MERWRRPGVSCCFPTPFLRSFSLGSCGRSCDKMNSLGGWGENRGKYVFDGCNIEFLEAMVS